MTDQEKKIYSHVKESSDPWDQLAVKMWDHAQARHKGRMRIRGKRDTKWTLAFWTVIKWIVKVFTFGKGFDLLDGNYTIMGRTIYCPGNGERWFKESKYWRCSMISHELAHFDHWFFNMPNAQDLDPIDNTLLSKRSTFTEILMYPWLLLWAIGYICLPLPYGFALFRLWIEYHGFKRTMMYDFRRDITDEVYSHFIEDGNLSPTDDKLMMLSIDLTKSILAEGLPGGRRNHNVKYLSGWGYGKMTFKFHAEKVVDKMFKEVTQRLKTEKEIKKTKNAARLMLDREAKKE